MVRFKTKSGKIVSFKAKSEKATAPKRKRSMGGKKKGGRKSSGGWRKKVYASIKKPSLSQMVTAGAVVVTVTGWGSTYVAKFVSELNAALKNAGIAMVVTGASLVLGIVALVAICTFAPNKIGKPVNAFLARWGLRL